MPVVVHINSWPGAGKLTIAQCLAEIMDARVLDNHTLMNPVLALFERQDAAFTPARAAVRAAVLEQGLKLPVEVPIVFTNALGQSAHDRGVLAEIEAFAVAREAVFVPVVLRISEAENVRRLKSIGRLEQRKLVDAGVLETLRGTEVLLGLDADEAIVLDVTDLTAKAAAQKLAAKLAELAGD